jgi:MvaI/BcnI restriction endonuclease family
MNFRPLVANEAKNLVSINNTGNASVLLFVTATGLEKAIFDATEPIRRYFAETGFHFYANQSQGDASKVIKACKIVGDEDIFETRVSLYRPLTKSGDSRLWIYNAGRYVKPDDILSLVVLNDVLYVFNLSQLKPLQSMVREDGFTSAIIVKINPVADELLERFRELSKRELFGDVKADTAVGRAIETALGIKANSHRAPDYKGIEIKTSRSIRVTTRSNLFAKTPDWEISTYKGSKALLDRFGYVRGAENKLYCTVSSRTPNSQGLFLRLADEMLEERFYKEKGAEEPVCVWRLKTLHESLTEKHRETFWVNVQALKSSNREVFRVIGVTHTSRPSTFNFDALLETGDITVDHLIKRVTGKDSARDKGYLFKVQDDKRSQLFLGEQREFKFS